MSKVIKSIKIGSKRLKNNLFLAPMLGFTNFAFRELIQETSKINVFTEMISINALSKDSNYCKDQLKTNNEKNLFYQFFGNDEKKLNKSIENTLKHNDVEFINLNCGCPASDIISQGAGSALLKRESKIYTMIKECKKEYNIPFTIKIRTGFDYPKHLNYEKLEEIGLDAIFIHGRTKKQQYSGEIDLNFIKEAKEMSKIPIISNGDIHNKKNIENYFEKTFCDGFMIGRGALKNPFIFEEVLNNKNNKIFDDKITFLEKYYKMLTKDTKMGFNETKNLSMFICKDINNACSAREKIAKAKTFGEIKATLKKLC